MLRTYVNEGQEDYFDQVADAFYKASEETFGNITPYFAIDPFHEGGNKGGLNESLISQNVQRKMLEYNADAVWVVQNWQNNPTKALLDGVDKDHTVVLDLYADNQPHYNPTTLAGANKPAYMQDDYDKTNWIWDMLHSFGGRMGFSGMLEVLGEELPNQLESEYMKGIGVIAESVATNPLLYTMIYDMGWEHAPIDIDDYISDYFTSRYGIQSDNIDQAWDIMQETAYHKRYDRQRPEDTLINAQPNLNANTASGYITAVIDYDKAQFEKILQFYLLEYNNLKHNDAYLYDLADITRQVLSNSAYDYIQEAKAAYAQKDAIKFKELSDKIIEIIALQDNVLRTTDEFSVGKWIHDARTMLESADDWTADLFEFNARAQITTWGSGAAYGTLKDYSNRQWSGLTEDYYLGRWTLYFDTMNEAAARGEWFSNVANVGINWFDYTYQWVNLKGNIGFDGEAFAITKDTSLQLDVLAKQALDEFSVTHLESGQLEEKENIALDKNVSAPHSLPEFNVSHINDGDNQTLWKTDDYDDARVEMTIGDNVQINGLELEFKTPEEHRIDTPTYYQ